MDTSVNSRIQWEDGTRKLKDLIPWEDNPRTIDEESAGRLASSLDEFGQVEVIAIGPDDQVYNGHQRLRVWLEEYGGDLEVDVRIASRSLSEQERQKLTVYLHEGATGHWDAEVLGELFDQQDLLDWGFGDAQLNMLGLDEIKEEEQAKEEDKGRLTITPELFERHDYLVFYFDNELDWNVITDLFGVERVLSGVVGKRTLVKKGLGRVIPGSKLLEMLRD